MCRLGIHWLPPAISVQGLILETLKKCFSAYEVDLLKIFISLSICLFAVCLLCVHKSKYRPCESMEVRGQLQKSVLSCHVGSRY